MEEITQEDVESTHGNPSTKPPASSSHTFSPAAITTTDFAIEEDDADFLSSSPSSLISPSPVFPSNISNRQRIRFSIDASAMETLDPLSKSPGMNEADHLYTSGLRRIRQGANPSTARPAGSLSVPPTRASSMYIPQSSPTLGSHEDLARFPSESLHSFSFAHQSEDLIHSRQNILKRSIEYMRDKLGWANQSPMITAAQATLAGDEELKGMMELFQKANLPGIAPGTGPLTGPAELGDVNPFDQDFVRSRSKDGEEEDVDPLKKSPEEELKADDSTSRSTTGDSKASTAQTSPPLTRRSSLKRTFTDTLQVTVQNKLLEALAQPYQGGDPNSIVSSPHPSTPMLTSSTRQTMPGVSASIHGRPSRYAPAHQAIFTTESHYPWTILAANDLACLVFGVTKAEVRKIGILEVVKEERREWLTSRLQPPGSSHHSHTGPASAASTVALLQRPNSRRVTPRRAKTDESKKDMNGHHHSNKSRGVILCGDVVPIQKRNGHGGAASLWVKEKKGGLIWVLEEINEDVAFIYGSAEEPGKISSWEGEVGNIYGEGKVCQGTDIHALMPGVPRLENGCLDQETLSKVCQYTANCDKITIPCAIETATEYGLRISSFPHIAGIVVLSASTMCIKSSNSVFSAALFGYPHLHGMHVNELIPSFDRMLAHLRDEDKVDLVDGIVVPEHSFRRARALVSLRDGKPDINSVFLRPSGLLAVHRDGGKLKVDVQMRVVKSESIPSEPDVEDGADSSEDEDDTSEIVYALWITYSRSIHAASEITDPLSPLLARAKSPLAMPSPGQAGTPVLQTPPIETQLAPPVSLLSTQLVEVSSRDSDGQESKVSTAGNETTTTPLSPASSRRKAIRDYVILEDMGQGAYGQVKLARYRNNHLKKVVLKYVTKKRILVDTWTRDRRLGTVPLEIHVLDYLKRDGLRHPNIVEMTDFFEDDINYYIEMLPHGLPGMDLFDYIELKVNMDENECRSIFVQVARALHHLHTKAEVVHRDIKDENIVLDGAGNIKLIDFGSAAYIRNGPFDVFVGTIDYAAPEVLAGKRYDGTQQDVWALGVLLYTICYKENPFYNIDEIMDRDIRIPYIMSDESIDLIKKMLDRDLVGRVNMESVLQHPWCQLALSEDGGELPPVLASIPAPPGI